MSDIGEFLASMQMLQRGMQDISTQKAISDATAEMQQANLSIKDEWERSQVNQQLANRLATTLTATGANHMQIAQASNAIAGKQFATPEEAMFHGVMGGNQNLVSKGRKAQSTINATADDFKQQALDIQWLAAELKNKKAQGTTFDPTQHNWADLKNLEALPKEIRPRVIPGMGVIANEKDRKEILEPLKELNNVSKRVDSILSRVQKGRLDYTNRTLIDQEANALASSLRIALTGPGPLTPVEKEYLNDIAGNPSNIRDLILSKDSSR
jgi:hypothetical protein